MPTIPCRYDGCCDFEPMTHNHVFCTEHNCKRKMENWKKRAATPVPLEEDIFEAKFRRADANSLRTEASNEWVLKNKRWGVLDIETTDLAANFGTVVCACIKDVDGETTTFVTRGDSDFRTVKNLRDEIAKYDFIVTWYGTGFDIPFITTRWLIGGGKDVSFARHYDMYYTARHRLRLHSNRLDCVQEALYGASAKTRLSPEWRLALRSVSPAKRRAAIEYHVEHCMIDVDETKDLFLKLAPFKDLTATPQRRY